MPVSKPSTRRARRGTPATSNTEKIKNATAKQADHLNATAYHEAGHAVAACLLNRPFHHVSIEPDAGSRGHVIFKEFTARIEERLTEHADDTKTQRLIQREIMI